MTRLMAAVILVALVTGVLAERSFMKRKVVTVRAACGSLDTRIITLQGRLYPLEPNRYLLVDTTGRVEVETCPVWYKHIILEPIEKVTVTGERLLDRPRGNGAVFVMAAYCIDSRGRNIILRERLGKPPWAFSRTPRE